MKKILFSILLLTAFRAYAQTPQPEVIQGKRVAVRTPVVINDDPDALAVRQTRDENGLMGVAAKTAIIRPFKVEQPPRVDPALQISSNGNIQSPAGINVATATIGTNVNGLGYTSVNPSDPVLATGPNHVIQMINGGSGSVMKIFNKNGTQTLAQFNFSNITGVQGAGDPILLYDQLARRWLLTEFGYSGGITSFVNTLILAVSTADDPLGSWNVYAYADNTFFVDFPKFSVWTDGYYATSNDFNTGGTAYLGSSVYAFDRNAMLAGNITATGIRTRLTNADGRYFSMAPVSIEGPTLPPVGRKHMFLYYTNDVFTADPVDVDSLYMITMTPDFVTPANTVISAPTRFVTTPFDDDLCAATRGRCIDQQTNTTVDLEDLSGRITNKIVYRNFGTHEGIACNFTVDADGAGKGGIRWMELRNTGTWGIFQEGTWAPDANERWLGAVCYDAVGNIGLAYNVSGTTANPSIRFTARNPCDPAGTMTLPETVIINGSASNSSNRYGDYNVLTIDPATDRDFWLTAQYNSATTWSTRIASFSLNNCNAQPRIRFQTNQVQAYEDSMLTAGTGCTRYRDYVVNVVIDAAPTQPAIVTFAGSGTATNGSDYTITPASVTLNSGTLSAPVTIRVFADVNLEGIETLQLTYAINPSGGNAVADNYNQSLSINIIDNDKAILPIGSNAVLMSEGFGTTATPGPVSGTWTIINPNTVTNTWTYSANGGTGITSGAAHITNSTTTNPLAYTNTVNDTATLRSPLIDATNYTGSSDSLKLYLRYKCNGELSGGTYYDFGRLRYSLNGTTFITIPGSPILQGVSAATDLTVNLPSTLKGQQFYIGYYWQNDNSVGNNPPFTIDSTAVTVSGIKPESTASSSGTAYLTSTQPGALLSAADGDIIATVSNMNNIGCIAASLPAAGNGRQSATINGSTAFRSDKVIQLSPALTYFGPYQATLYFTSAEVSVWGAIAPSLNILKVPDSDPLGASITGTILTPVAVDDQRATRGFISYTVSTSSFSKFMLTNSGLGPLPVQQLSFGVRPLQKSMLLNWTTTAEQNTRHFLIERSVDGVQFTSIATVAAQGNSARTTNYTFTDPQVQIGITYFYRLRLVDRDGQERYSEIRLAKLDDLDGSMVLQPNPAVNKLQVIAPLSNLPVQISIMDASGKRVLQQQSTSANGVYQLNIETLQSGVYMVKLTGGGRSWIAKLVKQ